MLAVSAAGSFAWFALLAFAAWLIRGQTGFDRAGTEAFLLLTMLLILAGGATAMTLWACAQHRAWQRAAIAARGRLQMITAAPLGAAAMSWLGVLGVSAL